MYNCIWFLTTENNSNNIYLGVISKTAKSLLLSSTQGRNHSRNYYYLLALFAAALGKMTKVEGAFSL